MLTSKQRAYLRGLASTMDPVIQIGKAGITDTLVSQTSDVLETRELIKVRIEKSAELETDEYAGQLAALVQAEVVGKIGRTFALFRRSTKKPRIELPQ